MARPTAIRGKKNRWISNVHTVSTYPPKGLFTKSAATISKTLASKRVSPKGPGSGMRMLIYFINRGGKGLSSRRLRELQKAKILLSMRIKKARLQKTGKKRSRTRQSSG
jgi:Protein of unknown function (DUF3175)